MNRSFTKKRGYSLIETVVYVALVAFLLASIASGTKLLFTAYQKTKAVRMVENGAIDTMDRIVRETRNSTSVNTSGSSFNVASGILSLVSGATTTKFYVSNNRVYIDQNGSTIGALTPSTIKVPALTFRYIDTGNSEAVKIELTLSASTTPSFSESFYDSVVLRGSY